MRALIDATPKGASCCLSHPGSAPQLGLVGQRMYMCGGNSWGHGLGIEVCALDTTVVTGTLQPIMVP